MSSTEQTEGETVPFLQEGKLLRFYVPLTRCPIFFVCSHYHKQMDQKLSLLIAEQNTDVSLCHRMSLHCVLPAKMLAHAVASRGLLAETWQYAYMVILVIWYKF